LRRGLLLCSLMMTCLTWGVLGSESVQLFLAHFNPLAKKAHQNIQAKSPKRSPRGKSPARCVMLF